MRNSKTPVWGFADCAGPGSRRGASLVSVSAPRISFESSPERLTAPRVALYYMLRLDGSRRPACLYPRHGLSFLMKSITRPGDWACLSDFPERRRRTFPRESSTRGSEWCCDRGFERTRDQPDPNPDEEPRPRPDSRGTSRRIGSRPSIPGVNGTTDLCRRLISSFASRDVP